MSRLATLDAQTRVVDFPYLSLRSVVSPEDEKQGRKRYCGIARSYDIFRFDLDENVRTFLGRDEEDRKRRSTLVNLQIRDTLEQNPDLFALRNGGIVIVAQDVKVDDAKRIATITGASIINGAQTQGVLREYFETVGSDRDKMPSISFELIVTDDDELVADISIARNYQNRVEDISIYGRRGLFDELEAELKKHDSGLMLRTSETQYSDEYVDTEKLIQVLTALAPKEVLLPSVQRSRMVTPETTHRVYAYRHRSRCLRDYADVMKDPDAWPEAKSLYLDLVWDALQLYKRLKRAQFFSRLVKVEKTGKLIGGRKEVAPDGVPDGLVFPMLSALSIFVQHDGHHWKLNIPSYFPWDLLYTNATNQWRTAAHSNPQTMGKNAGCYVAIRSSIEGFLIGMQMHLAESTAGNK